MPHGFANGIYIDGLDNPGLYNVQVTGLTVINANYEGILVTGASSPLPYGVNNNTVVGNHISGNGLAGEGAGVGIFAPGPGNVAFGNQVIGNVIVNNRLPGITVHNHDAPAGAPGANLNAITIIGNYISGNGADTEDAATPGTAGINIFGIAGIWATEILDNTIENEAFDVVMNNPGSMDVHLNNLLGGGTGIANIGKGGINATTNFFGCAGGPGATGCTKTSGSGIVSSPSLGTPVSTAPNSGAARGRP